jgi:uncharacterized protein
MPGRRPAGARPKALVTGASSGIGAAFAERLASDGYDLIVVARRQDRLASLAERLAATGAAVEALPADLTAEDGLRRVEARAAGDDRLVLLVNNAGFGGYGFFAEVEPSVIDQLIDVHVRAVARFSRAALPGMLARGAGAIVNVASLLAFSATLPPDPLPHRATYAGAKAFVVTFTQALAGELAGTPVRAMALCPGVVATEFHGGRPMRLPEMRPEDVVAAALAGLAGGEVVCVRGLETTELLDQLRDDQRAIFRAVSQADLARRYRSPE